MMVVLGADQEFDGSVELAVERVMLGRGAESLADQLQAIVLGGENRLLADEQDAGAHTEQDLVRLVVVVERLVVDLVSTVQREPETAQHQLCHRAAAVVKLVVPREATAVPGGELPEGNHRQAETVRARVEDLKLGIDVDVIDVESAVAAALLALAFDIGRLSPSSSQSSTE